MRTLILIGALTAVIVFPWPLALAAGALAALPIPLAPLAAGIFADTLYLAPHASAFPYATLVGGALALAALLVRMFLEARIMHA